MNVIAAENLISRPLQKCSTSCILISITVIWFMVVVHLLLDGYILTMNQFVGNKGSRDLCLRCNHKVCTDSLAGQMAILKVEVSCPREMPLQFKC